jgi:hypothetical protein
VRGFGFSFSFLSFGRSLFLETSSFSWPRAKDTWLGMAIFGLARVTRFPSEQRASPAFFFFIRMPGFDSVCRSRCGETKENPFRYHSFAKKNLSLSLFEDSLKKKKRKKRKRKAEESTAAKPWILRWKKEEQYALKTNFGIGGCLLFPTLTMAAHLTRTRGSP